MKDNLSFYPDDIEIKNGKVEKKERTQKSTPNILSLLGKNQNISDLLPLLLSKANGINPKDLSSIMANFQKTTPKTDNTKVRQFENVKFEDM